MWLSEVKPEAVKGRGRGKGAQSDRHMDRQDTDTARGRAHTQTHICKPSQAPTPGRRSVSKPVDELMGG